MPVATPSSLAPEWLAHRYDPDHDAVHFVRVDRSTRTREPFLIDDHLPAAAEPVVIRREEALALAPPAAPIHFIFHSAYCCSTLLANVLDRAGTAATLKEPTILNDLVGWRHRGGPPNGIARALDSALSLLARPLQPGEAVIVKPSNVVNELAAAMAAMRPAAGMLLLHAPLPVYLASVASKGITGRLWVRDLLMKQLRGQFVDLGFTPEDHLLQTDLQVAAVGWLAQHKLFGDLARRYPDRARSLDSELFLARPRDSLAALNALFGLGLSDEAVGLMAESGAFRRNAKDGARFRSEARKAAQSERAGLYGDELEKVAIWAEEVARAAGISIEPPAPLLHAE